MIKTPPKTRFSLFHKNISQEVLNKLHDIVEQNQQKASINRNKCLNNFVASATQHMLHPAGLHRQLPKTSEQYVQSINCTNPQHSSPKNATNLHQQQRHNKKQF